jgi:hypothetical protein
MIKAERTKEKIEQVRQESQWESEKENIALEKFRKRFLDAIETERIEVTAFKVGSSLGSSTRDIYFGQTNHSVTTFRTTKLPPHIEAALKPLYSEQKKKQEDVKSKDKVGYCENDGQWL